MRNVASTVMWAGRAEKALVLALAMVATSTTSLLVATKPAEAAFPGGNGKIVFSSDRAASDGSADYEIYVINTDGRISTTQLTDNSSQLSDEDPTFSPDGSKIAYSSRFHRDIWVMNADGSGTPTQLTNDQVEDHSPAWSPDGEKIAFGSNRQGLDGSRDPDIFVMNADGSGTPTRLTNDAGWEPPNPTYDDYAPPSHPTAPR